MQRQVTYVKWSLGTLWNFEKNFKVEIKWTNGTKKLFKVSELNQTII